MIVPLKNKTSYVPPFSKTKCFNIYVCTEREREECVLFVFEFIKYSNSTAVNNFISSDITIPTIRPVENGFAIFLGVQSTTTYHHSVSWSRKITAVVWNQSVTSRERMVPRTVKLWERKMELVSEKPGIYTRLILSKFVHSYQLIKK